MAVYDANNLDIEAVGQDGSVELFIISSGRFDDSNEQQTLLMNKIENYIGYILSEEFKHNHPDSSKEKIWIVLSLDKNPVHCWWNCEEESIHGFIRTESITEQNTNRYLDKNEI